MSRKEVEAAIDRMVGKKRESLSKPAKQLRKLLQESGDVCQGASLAGDELDDVKPNYTQYIRSGNSFSPTGKVVLAASLQKFAYRLVQTMGGVVFEKMRPRTDELLSFPSSAMHNIIEEIDKFWRLKDNFTRLGFLHNRGILVYGPPGTGKSCMMQQVAEKMVEQGDVIFFAKSLSPVESGLKAFREIEPDRKAVVVLEDLDEYLQYSERDLLQLLDGDNSVDNVLYLGSTNYIEKFPPRLLRPGRFDKCIHLGPPPLEGRMVYLRHKLKTLEEDDAIKQIAEQTAGLSFGHLRELVIAAYAFEENLAEVISRLKRTNVQELPERTQLDEVIAHYPLPHVPEPDKGPGPSKVVSYSFSSSTEAEEARETLERTGYFFVGLERDGDSYILKMEPPPWEGKSKKGIETAIDGLLDEVRA